MARQRIAFDLLATEAATSHSRLGQLVAFGSFLLFIIIYYYLLLFIIIYYYLLYVYIYMYI